MFQHCLIDVCYLQVFYINNSKYLNKKKGWGIYLIICFMVVIYILKIFYSLSWKLIVLTIKIQELVVEEVKSVCPVYFGHWSYTCYKLQWTQYVTNLKITLILCASCLYCTLYIPIYYYQIENKIKRNVE